MLDHNNMSGFITGGSKKLLRYLNKDKVWVIVYFSYYLQLNAR